MNKKVLVFALLVFGLTGSALALAPMGPPTAGLKTGQFRVGIDYSYSEEDMDVEDETLDKVTSNMVFANLGYGIMDEWEIFGRLGMADIQADDILDSGVDFSGDFKFAWGVGTKYTFLKQESLDWGFLFQVTSVDSDDTVGGTDIDIDYYDWEFAVGPTWKLNDTWSIYGGPFVHFIDGDVDIEGYDSGDLEEDSMWGGYVGAEAELCQNTSLFGEFQFTGGGWAFGTGIGWKF
jgi:hypothetical protein